MLENDAAWLVFSVFPTMFDHRQIQRLGLISLFYNSRSRTARSCSTSTVSSFSCPALTRTYFGPYPNSLGHSCFLLPLPLLSSLCSLNCGTRWSAQSRLPWAIRTQERIPAQCAAMSLSSFELEPSRVSPSLFKCILHLLFLGGRP
jgi:hypothetical protein